MDIEIEARFNHLEQDHKTLIDALRGQLEKIQKELEQIRRNTTTPQDPAG